MGEDRKTGKKGFTKGGSPLMGRLFSINPGGFKVETALGGFTDFPFFYCRNRPTPYGIRLAGRCSTILHPNLHPQGVCGCGASWAKSKKAPQRVDFLAFAPLPGCVWSSPFCPPAEVSGREVAGRGSGQRKSTQLPGCDQIPFLRFLGRVRDGLLGKKPIPLNPTHSKKAPAGWRGLSFLIRFIFRRTG